MLAWVQYNSPRTVHSIRVAYYICILHYCIHWMCSFFCAIPKAEDQLYLHMGIILTHSLTCMYWYIICLQKGNIDILYHLHLYKEKL